MLLTPSQYLDSTTSAGIAAHKIEIGSVVFVGVRVLASRNRAVTQLTSSAGILRESAAENEGGPPGKERAPEAPGLVVRQAQPVDEERAYRSIRRMALRHIRSRDVTDKPCG